MKKGTNSRQDPRRQQVRAFLKKLLASALIMGATCYTIVFFAPLQALSDVGNAIAYTPRDVWHILALIAGFAFILGTAVLVSLQEKALRITLTVLFSLTVCCGIQLLLNRPTDMPNNRSYTVSSGFAIFDLLLWLAVFSLSFYLLFTKQTLWRKVMLYGAGCLLVLQGIFTVTIVANNTYAPSIEEYQLSAEGMYQYSSENNVFVFVLDRLDYEYVEKVAKKDPDFFNELDGFTCYTNAMSTYARTKPALNNMLTGSEDAYFVPTQQYLDESWTQDSKDILGDLQDSDYTVELYTNPTYLFGTPAYAEKNVDNLFRNNTLQEAAVLPGLLQLAGQCCAPNVLKGIFWSDSAGYNANVFVPTGEPGYSYDDPYYGQGFKTATANRTGKAFKFYHFFGAHNPYSMKADGTAAQEGEEPTVVDQTMGCFVHLYNAFAQMKALGVYEDATIIITADHGAALSDRKSIYEIIDTYHKVPRIGLFYKPSGAAGTELCYSDAPVSTTNIPATIAQAAGFEDISRYGTPLDQVPEEAQITRTYYKTITPKGLGPEVDVYEYAITGDVADPDNWKETKVTKGIPEENSFF